MTYSIDDAYDAIEDSTKSHVLTEQEKKVRRLSTPALKTAIREGEQFIKNRKQMHFSSKQQKDENLDIIFDAEAMLTLQKEELHRRQQNHGKQWETNEDAEARRLFKEAGKAPVQYQKT